MQGTTADKIREEAMKKAQAEQSRQNEQTPNNQQQTAQSEPSNFIDNAAKLFSDKLLPAFTNAMLKNLAIGFEEEVNRLANAANIEPNTSKSNPVIDVFCSTHTQAYGTNNIRVISSSSVSTSLPSASISNGQTTNGNSKGFEPKN